MLWVVSVCVLLLGSFAYLRAKSGGFERASGTAAPDASSSAAEPEVIHGTKVDAIRVLDPLATTWDPPVDSVDGPPPMPGQRTGQEAPSRVDGEKRPRIPNDYFEARYAGHRLEDLAGAKARIEMEFFKAQDDAISARFESGLYEAKVIPRIEREPTAEDFTPVPKGGLIYSQQASVLENGDLEQRTTFLPYGEYIQIYDQQDELFWLSQEIWKIQQSGH